MCALIHSSDFFSYPPPECFSTSQSYQVSSPAPPDALQQFLHYNSSVFKYSSISWYTWFIATASPIQLFYFQPSPVWLFFNTSSFLLSLFFGCYTVCSISISLSLKDSFNFVSSTNRTWTYMQVCVCSYHATITYGSRNHYPGSFTCRSVPRHSRIQRARLPFWHLQGYKFHFSTRLGCRVWSWGKLQTWQLLQNRNWNQEPKEGLIWVATSLGIHQQGL